MWYYKTYSNNGECALKRHRRCATDKFSSQTIKPIIPSSLIPESCSERDVSATGITLFIPPLSTNCYSSKRKGIPEYCRNQFELYYSHFKRKKEDTE